jgi:ATP-dependent Clp endopeptidase proteolytic subunit ClpP
MLNYTNFGPNIKSDCFIQKPEVIIVTKFDEDGYTKFYDAFQRVVNAKLPVIPIMIDSYGGQIYSLLGMIDLVRSARVPVLTFIPSKAMSAGGALFSCGTDGYRYVAPNAHVMIHQAGGGGIGKVEDVQTSANQLTVLNKQLMKLMSRNCGKNPTYWDDQLAANKQADIYLNSHKAVECGLANYVGTPQINVEVTQDVTITVKGKR